jgi:cobalt-zinc-cadmium efflux system protein
VRLTFLDPLLSIGLAIWIFTRVFKPLMSSLDIFLQNFPVSISKDELERVLKGFEEVAEIHHTHLWSIDESSHVLTTHIAVKRVLTIEELGKLKREIKHSLRDKFGIIDTTIEIELPGQECADPEHPSEF